MIDPTVEIVDCDPAAMAWINRIMRSRPPAREISIVTDGVVVAQVAGDVDDAVAIGDPVDDPPRFAARVRAEVGADLVTIIDRRAVDDIPAALDDLARRCRSQGELLWRAREVWHGHPGVTIDPPPTPAGWPRIADFLGVVPDGAWLVVTVRQPDRVMSLAAQVSDGLIVLITSTVPADATIAARLDAPADALAAVLAAGDPVGRLASLLMSPDVEHVGLAEAFAQA